MKIGQEDGMALKEKYEHKLLIVLLRTFFIIEFEIIKQEYGKCDPYNFIEDIKKYIIDIRYIKINDKAIIGLYEHKKVENLSNTISTWRENAKKLGLGEIYITIII